MIAVLPPSLQATPGCVAGNKKASANQRRCFMFLRGAGTVMIGNGKSSSNYWAVALCPLIGGNMPCYRHSGFQGDLCSRR